MGKESSGSQVDSEHVFRLCHLYTSHILHGGIAATAAYLDVFIFHLR